MPLVSLDGASLAFGHVPLLDHVSAAIDRGERLALIGRNGSGKSSLLRVLTGESSLDDGLVRAEPGARIALVAQEPQFAADQDAYDAIAGGLGAISAQLIEYHDLGTRLGAAPSTEALERLHALQSALEHADGWRLDTRVEQTLAQLGLAGNARIETLSGGMLKRVALGRALVAQPDLLLLDEPTNHLDIDGIEWLETLLVGYAGAVMVVTHDRRFLDRVATRILELDRGELRSYPGRYVDYQARKSEELAAESAAQARFDKLLAQEEAWIRKGIEARRTRNEGRVRRLEALRRERFARRERLGTAQLAVDRGDLSGRLVAELVDVSKSYADEHGTRSVVRDLSCRIMRGDKVGFIGPNGAGKTTLLKLILGEVEPDSGSVRLGTRLQIAYFDQFRAQLDPDATLVEVISPGSEFVEIAGRRQHVIGYLGDFLFPPQRARSQVRSLSGGERNRLLLARLFARPANVIVLDEPTNDLDIETLELLEALLADYDATVLLVTHDRAFLDAVATQTIAYEGDGVWREYAGGFEDWWRVKRAQAQQAQAQQVQQAQAQAQQVQPKPLAGTAQRSAAAPKPAARRNDEGPRKLTFAERRELDQLPARIDALEGEQKTLGLRLADPALYQRAPQEVAAVRERLQAVEGEIAAAMHRWEMLATRE
ncbi:MAG: ATP-binding cassette domain-containing protein [Betaproteobacteria bacterium]|nr:ATP-binding cassette domain-containing protein [Betaproteobacteria bacterium]